MTIHPPALACARQQAVGQPFSQPFRRSSHVAVRPSREDTQRQASGVLLDCCQNSAKPPCWFEANGRHRPAGLSPKPGRPRPPSAVCPVFGFSQDPLAGWLETAASLLPARGGPCLSCSCQHQTNLVRSRDISKACHSLACRRGIMRVRDASFFFFAFLYFYLSGWRARSRPSSNHAYNVPALGLPPRLLAPGIETIEIRPFWPSSTTSYPTGGSFSSSFSSALFP